MQVVILAAGEGSRLAPLTSYIPKPLLPIDGKPILNHIIEGLWGEPEVHHVIVVGLEEFREQFMYALKPFENKPGEKRLFNVAFSDRPAGTAGELLRIWQSLEEEFLVYYADIWTQFRVGEVIRWWGQQFPVYKEGYPGFTITPQNDAIAGLVASRMLKVDKGVVDIGGMDEVLMLREKPEIPVPNLMGIGIYKKAILRYAKTGEDLHGDTLPKAIGGGERVLAFLTDEGYEDLGTLRAYKAVQKGERSTPEPFTG